MAYTGLSRHKLMFGVDAQKNTRLEQIYYETNPQNTLLSTNNPSHVASVFVQDEWHFHSEWRLNISLRHDKHSDFSGVSSPRGALVWQATPRLSLKAILGQAYRFPNAYERFYHDGNVTQSANPNLKPEQIRSRELAASYSIGQGGRIGVSLYDNNIRNMIDQVTDQSGVSTYTNFDKVHAHGIELDTEKRWASGYRLRGSITWQQSKLADGAGLDDSPQRLGKLIAGIPLAYGWTASGEVLGSAARKGSNGPVAGYGIINLKLQSAQSTKFGQISLALYNLGDKRYYAPANAYLTQHAIEQPRRQIMLRYTHGL